MYSTAPADWAIMISVVSVTMEITCFFNYDMLSSFWGCNQKPALKQINKAKQNKKLLDVKVQKLKINKSEIKTNETLNTQVTNTLFYKEDKTDYSSPYAGINALIKYKTKATLKHKEKLHISYIH